MEQQLGLSAEHGLEWQIILTDNEAVIVRRRTPIIEPAAPLLSEDESAVAQQPSQTRNAAPAHPRIYANMR